MLTCNVVCFLQDVHNHQKEPISNSSLSLPAASTDSDKAFTHDAALPLHNDAPRTLTDLPKTLRHGEPGSPVSNGVAARLLAVTQAAHAHADSKTVMRTASPVAASTNRNKRKQNRNAKAEVCCQCTPVVKRRSHVKKLAPEFAASRNLQKA